MSGVGGKGVVTAALISAVLLSGCGAGTRGTLERWDEGDTAVVKVGAKFHRLGLGMYEAPEMRDNEKAREQAREWATDVDTVIRAGKWSKAQAEKIIPPGTAVRYILWSSRRDEFGRMPASIIPAEVLEGK